MHNKLENGNINPKCHIRIIIFISLCPKSPSVRGFVASLPVRLLFKYLSHNAFYPVSSLSQCGIKFERTKLGKMHCFIHI